MNTAASAGQIKISELADEGVREHYLAEIAPRVRKIAGKTVQSILDMREVLMSSEEVSLDVQELIEAVADVLKRNAPDWAAAENAEGRSVALHSHARANSLRSAEQWTRDLTIEYVTVIREAEEEPSPF